EEGIRSQGFHLENPDMTRVLDIMTPAVISFEETTSIRDLAKEMLKKRIHRVPITRRGQLCGIVTSIDLLRALLELIERHPGAFRLPLEKVAG
ncbi:MAG TPA: CBS domain-containing protein, partial [Elusimicrobiota bacterium]|nr:CBS domain-containing protein [Elusimicrobiota bacterium]